MATVTISSKHQITLPVDMVRDLNLRPGDKLVVQLVEDHMVLLPQPESWADYLVGSVQGVYGSTKEEVDRYIAEVRYGWDADSLGKDLSLDADLRLVYEATSSTEARSLSQIAEKSGVDGGYVTQHLSQLDKLHAVEQLEHPKYKAEPYYRRTR